ncbi:MAG: hypothetical protein WAL61_06400 [Acidimicrobiales bacterium]
MSVLTVGVTSAAHFGEEHPLTLTGLESAIRSSWSIETCDPTDVPHWSSDEPSRGQCAVTALVVHDLLGGELLEAEVDHADGSHQGFHYWNRFAGVDVDLTRRQFADGEVVLPPHLIERLPDVPWLAEEQYVIFRERVSAALRALTDED